MIVLLLCCLVVWLFDCLVAWWSCYLEVVCLEDSTERSESNPGRSLGTYRQKGSICLEDSTFQHSEKEATDKNKAQKVMLCKSIAFTLQ